MLKELVDCLASIAVTLWNWTSTCSLSLLLTSTEKVYVTQLVTFCIYNYAHLKHVCVNLEVIIMIIIIVWHFVFPEFPQYSLTGHVIDEASSILITFDHDTLQYAWILQKTHVYSRTKWRCIRISGHALDLPDLSGTYPYAWISIWIDIKHRMTYLVIQQFQPIQDQDISINNVTHLYFLFILHI